MMTKMKMKGEGPVNGIGRGENTMEETRMRRKISREGPVTRKIKNIRREKMPFKSDDRKAVFHSRQ